MRARWAAALLGAALLAGVLPLSMAVAEEPGQTGNPAGEVSVEPRAASKVYVSFDGSDESGNGSADSPYASLAKAVDEATDGATIYVMSNLTMTECARYYGKDLTITSGDGGPYTLTRDDGFDMISDTARSRYNPAMIEVGSTDGPGTASLTLTNIVLDDGGKRMGEYYIQAASNRTGNTQFGDMVINHGKIVQDAMIATYNGTGTITLGEGAVLKNFGGMSAVRLSSGTLVMESGSKIVDDTVTDRTKGATITGTEESYYGPAGAIWMQGGSVEMRQGAEISGIVGRAFYVDSGNVTINGTVSNVCSDTDMWWREGGSIVHLRSNATATLGSTGVVDGKGRTTHGASFDVLAGCEFTAAEGSVIKDIAGGGNIVNVSGTAYLNGEITGCTDGGHVICAQSSSNHYVRIGETSNIHHNTSAYGVIYTQGTNGVIDIYGKLNDNVSTDRGGALTLANNGSHVEVNMYDGAEMCRNVSHQTGGAVMVSCGTFTMNGGTISGNISGAGNVGDEDKVGGGVYVRRGGQFIMNGGTLSDNSSASIGGNIALDAGDYNGSVPYVELNGGSVTGGAMNVTVTESNGSYSVSGGEANDLTIVGGSTFGMTDRYLSVANDVQLSEQSVFMDDYDFYIENPGSDVKLGNASADCETYVKSELTSQNLTQVLGSYWYETTAAAQSFDISDLSYDASKELYAAIVATDSTGVPVAGGAVTLRAVDVSAGGSLTLSLPGQNATGYAVVFVQEGDQPAQVVTVTPADITVYEGGDGYSAVVGDDGATATSNSMPHPMFKIEGVADAEGMTFSNAEAGKSWTVVSDGNDYYHFEPSTGQDDVRVTYTDASGNAVTSNEFDVAAVNETFAQYAIDLYLGQNNLGSITAQHEGQDYTVALGTGTLTVRAVEAEDPATVTSSVATVAPSSPLASGTAMAVEPSGGTTYTLNDTGVPLPDDATPSLLFDEIITSDGVDRVTALRNRVDEELGGADPARQYQMKYLDLVDSNNSNAWITSENGIDIYWAYPEGTDESTNFSLLHLKGLHRDGAQSGFDVTDVDSCDADNVTIEKTAQGIRFHVAAGDFSPYVLTWEQHTITATAGEGGSISPSGAVIVTDGADQAFTITANEGYVISDVKVDGVSVGAVNSYAFSDVTSDHAIEVTFAAETVTPPAHEHTWSDWKCDGTSHWRVCEECGAVKDRSEHVFGAWEQIGDGLWERSCTVCGYVQEGTTEPAEDEGADKPTNESADEELPQSGDSTNATLTGLLAVGGVVVAGSAIALRARRRNG